jgi:hypothetical protein
MGKKVFSIATEEKHTRSARKLKVEAEAKDQYIIALMNLDPEWTESAISFDGVNYYATPMSGGTAPSRAPILALQQCFQAGNYSQVVTANCGQNLRVWCKFRNAQGLGAPILGMRTN